MIAFLFGVMRLTSEDTCGAADWCNDAGFDRIFGFWSLFVSSCFFYPSDRRLKGFPSLSYDYSLKDSFISFFLWPFIRGRGRGREENSFVHGFHGSCSSSQDLLMLIRRSSIVFFFVLLFSCANLHLVFFVMPRHIFFSWKFLVSIFCACLLVINNLLEEVFCCWWKHWKHTPFTFLNMD